MQLQITKKKVGVVLLFFLIATISLLLIGQQMLKSSDVFLIAQNAINQKIGEGSRIELAWWKPWAYGESDSHGKATFTICRDSKEKVKKCYLINAEKMDSKWSIVSIIENS